MDPKNISTLEVGRFYHFEPIEPNKLTRLASDLEDWAQQTCSRGLILIGTEGVNGTVAGTSEALDLINQFFKNYFKLSTFEGLKRNSADKNPFRRFKVKIKPEIVTLGRTDLVPQNKSDHLTPDQWHEWLQREDVLVLDTRNDFEVEMGKFKGAVDLGLKQFQEFPKKLQQAKINKNQPILIYCTGGIRCEKAILEMKEQGFREVKQLDGGILSYMEQMQKESLFDGECFVFDHRVGVNQNLEASQIYSLCPHCGQPAATLIECKQCGREEKVCQRCLNEHSDRHTCSKNCAHHFRHGHKTKKPHLDELKKRGQIP